MSFSKKKYLISKILDEYWDFTSESELRYFNIRQLEYILSVLEFKDNPNVPSGRPVLTREEKKALLRKVRKGEYECFDDDDDDD